MAGLVIEDQREPKRAVLDLALYAIDAYFKKHLIFPTILFANSTVVKKLGDWPDVELVVDDRLKDNAIAVGDDEMKAWLKGQPNE